MSSEVEVAGSTESEHFEASLGAEEEAERDLLRSLVRSVLVAVPISIAFFLLLLGIAIGDKVDWYVWVGLGVGIGSVGAVLMGSLAGATLNAHKLDEVDRQGYSH
jgi:Na+/proline symporter